MAARINAVGRQQKGPSYGSIWNADTPFNRARQILSGLNAGVEVANSLGSAYRKFSENQQVAKDAKLAEQKPSTISEADLAELVSTQQAPFFFSDEELKAAPNTDGGQAAFDAGQQAQSEATIANELGGLEEREELPFTPSVEEMELLDMIQREQVARSGYGR